MKNQTSANLAPPAPGKDRHSKSSSTDTKTRGFKSILSRILRVSDKKSRKSRSDSAVATVVTPGISPGSIPPAMMPVQGLHNASLPAPNVSGTAAQGFNPATGNGANAISVTVNPVGSTFLHPTSPTNTQHPSNQAAYRAVPTTWTSHTGTGAVQSFQTLTPQYPSNQAASGQAAYRAVPVTSTSRTSTGAAQSSQTVTHGQVLPSSIDPDIFTDNNVKKESAFIAMPTIGDGMDHTVQLVHGIRALAENSVSAVTVSPSSTQPTSNKSQDEWVLAMNEHPAEKEYLHHLTNKMVERFIVLPFKSPDTIREIVLLGPILDKEYYHKLLSSFLGEFERAALVDLDILLGMVQLVQVAPPKTLRPDSLIQILRSIRRRLEDPAQKKGEFLANLVLSATRILIIMVAYEIKDLDRVQEHEPLLNLLLSLRNSTDPLVKFQARYACQTLRSIPDDETGFQEFRRHLFDFTGGLLNMSKVIRLEFDGIVDSLPGFIQGGRGLLIMMKKTLVTESNAPWYQSVLLAEKLVQQGRLADLNKLICGAPCRRAPLFQWGICQLLGEIAVDQSCDPVTRGKAVKFLGQIFKSNIGQQGDGDVKRWILTGLNHIMNCQVAASSQFGTSSFAVSTPPIFFLVRDLIRDLERNHDESFPYVYPLRSQLPLPVFSSLLKEVNDTPDIELTLQRLRLRRRNEYDEQAVFVPQLSKKNLQASEENLVSLRQRGESFLASNRQVLLILGDSGAGKSTFIRKLEHDLWGKYKPGDPIPLFIDLKTVDKSGNDMIYRHLVEFHLFSEQQIRDMRRSRNFYLLCDGYDEWHKWSNIHTTNRFNQPQQWRTKMVITCRTQYLVSTYRGYFEPQSPNQNSGRDLYDEAVIVPFKMEQIKDYIDQYTASPESRDLFKDQPIWTSDRYMERLKGITNLMDLVKNPFMLRMVMDTLPKIKPSIAKITRAELYDEFTDLHFETELRRLVGQNARDAMAPDCSAYFSEIQGEDFVRLGVEFSKELALAIFKEQDGQNSVEYSTVKDEGTWKTKFFGPDTKARLFRESIQVVCRSSTESSGRPRKESNLARKRNAYEFSHRSLLEYFYSRLVYDPIWNPRQHDLSVCLEAVSKPSLIGSHPLAQKSIVPELSIIHFLAERVQQNSEFEGQLRAVVERSKKNFSIGHAAANAMTILVQAGVDFNGADLRSILVSGADLTGGHFDSADFQDAELKEVNFTRAWLRQANFSRAKMNKVQFGERPFLKEPDLLSCAVSLDKKLFCTGLKTGNILVYDISDWKKLFTLSTDRPTAPSVMAISSHRRYVASGYQIGVGVHVFDIRGGVSKTLTMVLPVPCQDIYTLEFSPDATLLATSSSRQAEGIHIWDIASASRVFFLPDQATLKYDYSPYTLVWSLDGQYLISVDHDFTIYPWRIKRGEKPKLETDTEKLKGLAYPPGGKRLVGKMRDSPDLRDASAIIEARTWVHTAFDLFAASFSPNGQWIVNFNNSEVSVGIFDARSGTSVLTLDGHTSDICFATFLSDREILSASKCGMVKIWDLGNEWSQKKTSMEKGLGSSRPGHSGTVFSVSFTPKGEQIVSAGEDGSVRLWDATTGISKETIQIKFQTRITISSPNRLDVFTARYGSPVRLMPTQRGLQLALCDSSSKLRLFDPVKGVAIPISDSPPRTALWNMESSSKDRVLRGHDEVVTGLVFSPNGRMLVSRSLDQTISFWNSETGTRIYQITIGNPSFGDWIGNKLVAWDCSAFAFSSCGSKVAIGFGKIVRIVHTSFDKDLPEMRGHIGLVVAITWSPDSRWIVTAANDHTVRLWKLNVTGSAITPQCIYVINDFVGAITSLAWNPSGVMEFVTGSEDESVCTWRIVTVDGAETRVELVWGSISNRLVCSAAKIANAVGLEPKQRILLEQRGALVGSQANSDYQRNLISPPPKPQPVSAAPRPQPTPGAYRTFSPRGNAPRNT
ncbi:hypothetical protein BGZ83_006891 [Gryganskiella cystojenkinii]|nr:hypothetical protein BGZ83_006891 [Gryganskiella cystojenkinii]